MKPIHQKDLTVLQICINTNENSSIRFRLGWDYGFLRKNFTKQKTHIYLLQKEQIH